MLNDASVLNWEKLLTGKDGRLFVITPDSVEPIFLAECNTFTIAMNVTNVDYGAVGSTLMYGVPDTVNYTLTLTAATVRDDLLIEPIIKAWTTGKMHLCRFTFQGAIYRPNADGTEDESRITCRNAIPAETINLQTLEPGAVIQREMSFRLNAHPELDKLFTL